MKTKFYFGFNMLPIGIQIAVVLLMLCISCTTETTKNDLSGKTKVVLRAVGNELLLSQNDSTSLVMPVVRISDLEYQLSFEKPLTFDPTDLHNALEKNIAKANLPQEYQVEVVRCSDGEVGYSFLVSGTEENNIIPCGGRLLPENCFTIHFTYLKQTNGTSSHSPLFYTLVGLVLAFLAFVFYSRYATHNPNAEENEHNSNATLLGSFYFYPDQNKLVKAATEIPLSRKECELLQILASNVNQIVKRESLEKQVWEDQGVVVGRSLDTYISKLRKKLKSDTSLKIVNVHGVGYKLEMEA